MCRSCGLWPFNPNWVVEHKDIFSVSRSLHDSQRAAESGKIVNGVKPWPSALSGTALFEHLLALSHGAENSHTIRALDLSSALDSAVDELKGMIIPVLVIIALM